jgi:hypothetical protein
MSYSGASQYLDKLVRAPLVNIRPLLLALGYGNKEVKELY